MNPSVAEPTLTPESCVVRDTAARKGRTRTVSPGPTAAKHLHYGRVILDEGDAPLTFSTEAAPGGSINFLWMMAANRETEDRLFGVVNVHPDFKQGGSGLDAGRK